MDEKKKTRVAVLGPLGTYTHEAAFKAFGPQVIYDERKSIADVFNSLSPILPLGVVPQENSIFGNVVETYDLLRNDSNNFIRGEITLKIEHCLVTKKGVKLQHIQKVMSHEQALGQCREFLAEKLPLAQTIKTPSTAAAAQALLNNPPDCAAICSSICATLFEGIEVLFNNIQNKQSNYTRFFISAHSRDMDSIRVLTKKCQMRALFRISTPSQGPQQTPNEIVRYLKSLDLQAARIDRRPSLNSKPFNSVYFVEVHGCSGGQGIDEILESWHVEVEKAAKRVKCEGGEVDVIGIW